MIPVKFLVALAAVYDGSLYVFKPPNCNSASITYDRAANNNVSRYKMDSAFLAEISVFKVSVRNFTQNDSITFKITFHFPSYVVDTNWQTMMLKNRKIDMRKKNIEPNNNYCCISTIIVGVALLATLSLCITYFFICWTLNYNNYISS